MTIKSTSASGNPSETKPVPNPCVGVCVLDMNDICTACHRSGMEIAEWGLLSDDQKREAWQRIVRRENGEVC